MSANPGISMSVALHGLKATHTHGPSGTTIVTVPPVDNGGDGSSYSPTDLLGASLASCALTTMALSAKRENLFFGDASAVVVKEMVGPPRRVGALRVSITMPKGVPVEQRVRLEEIARSCPVARSLSADVLIPMTFVYP